MMQDISTEFHRLSYLPIQHKINFYFPILDQFSSVLFILLLIQVFWFTQTLSQYGQNVMKLCHKARHKKTVEKNEGERTDSPNKIMFINIHQP